MLPTTVSLTPGIRLSTFREAGGYLSERFANVLQDAVL
jgi:hypothetical protein